MEEKILGKGVYERSEETLSMLRERANSLHKAGEDNPNWRGGKSGHPLYFLYYDMRNRCLNPKHLRYADYGGRGITVCQDWIDDFWAFVRDVGERPEGKSAAGRRLYSLDRIDNEGNYEPGNVRWATFSEQSLNRRQPMRKIRGDSNNESGYATNG